MCVPGVGGVLPLDWSGPKFPLDDAFVAYSLDDRADAYDASNCEYSMCIGLISSVFC